MDERKKKRYSNLERIYIDLMKSTVIEMTCIMIFLLIIIAFANMKEIGLGIFFVVLIIMLIRISYIYYVCISNMKKINKLPKDLKWKLNIELINPIFKSSIYEYILTENYIIKIKEFVIINYREIILIYKAIGVSMSSLDYLLTKRIIVLTKDKVASLNYASFIPSIGSWYKEDLIYFIREKNTNILLGKNRKNKQIVYEKYGIKIE